MPSEKASILDDGYEEPLTQKREKSSDRRKRATQNLDRVREEKLWRSNFRLADPVKRGKRRVIGKIEGKRRKSQRGIKSGVRVRKGQQPKGWAGETCPIRRLGGGG